MSSTRSFQSFKADFAVLDFRLNSLVCFLVNTINRFDDFLHLFSGIIHQSLYQGFRINGNKENSFKSFRKNKSVGEGIIKNLRNELVTAPYIESIFKRKLFEFLKKLIEGAVVVSFTDKIDIGNSLGDSTFSAKGFIRKVLTAPTNEFVGFSMNCDLSMVESSWRLFLRTQNSG
jgi:hypothetical protein